MTDIQAALGLIQIKRLNDFKRRHEIAERYDAELSSLPIATPYQAPATYSSHHLYPIRVNETESGRSQQKSTMHSGKPEFQQTYITFRRIDTRITQILVSRRVISRKQSGSYREMITLPMYPTLTEKQTDVIFSLNSIWGG